MTEEREKRIADIRAWRDQTRGKELGQAIVQWKDTDALLACLDEAREQRDEINKLLSGLTRIGLKEPEDHVFRFFQRLHGLPETGGPSGTTWKQRAEAAESEVAALRREIDVLRFELYGPPVSTPNSQKGEGAA